MLTLDDVIDLVIPRGSNALVSYIKANTRIPVLGHADGVCHVYVDSSADADTASIIAVDAKTDYPSACNAMETLLLHKDTLSSGVASSTLMALRSAGVKCLGGPKAMKLGLSDFAATELKYEYGDLTCLVEVVDDMDEAIEWIHKYGSGHTEAIVCSKDSPAGEEFLRKVDAACVFKNASTRFADGFRFGLGAGMFVRFSREQITYLTPSSTFLTLLLCFINVEVGISTGRIHARGPVGVEGLLTTKWQLRSENVDYVAAFGGDSPQKKFTHKELM
jgi:delta-1-pyrroline-5-carboxylate synthetase